MRHLAFGIALLALASAPAGPPPAPKRPVTHTYHGVAVRDDYEWLEDWSSPEVRRWSEAQNAYARSVLDALPGRAAIAARVAELRGAATPSYRPFAWSGGVLFALKTQPPKQHAFLITSKSADDLSGERVLVDPAQVDPKGETSIDWAAPSRDGRLVAVSLSKGGSESGDVHVFETATGRELPDVVARVNGGTAGGSVAWNEDASGFFYTRYPRPGERPPADLDFYQQVWFHRLGAPASQDSYAVGREFPRIAETELRVSDDGRSLLAVVRNGDGGEAALFLKSPEGRWTTLARDEDEVADGRFAPDGALYLLSRKGAPRGRILRIPAGGAGLASATVAAPESDGVIVSFLPTATRLYVVELAGGPHRLRVFDREGRSKELPILPVSSVSGLLRLAGDEVLYSNQSYVAPPVWYRVGADGHVSPTAIARRAVADFSDTEVVRELATSKDGTRIPLTILRRRGTKLDGSNPALLTGYGGFDAPQSPYYSDGLKLWIEQGGVFAIGNLRGGGEFGETWHASGMRTRKQNVFDDFLACAEFLVQAGYTRPSRFAIEGGSNGGLLMGAALTQRPDLFAAVVSHVGIYDMLRVELSANGAFNITEYGTVRDAAEFRALHAYSPYHHVVDGTRYPAVLMLTGANDPRVDPMQSRKMTARLQAAKAKGSDAPVLLRTSSGSGHGFGTSLDEALAQQTDVWSFLFWRLGVAHGPRGEAPRR
jgi:prolyl oligopeptidase